MEFPYHLYIIKSICACIRNRYYTIFQLGEWFFTLQFLAGCFAYSNSALNPLIYAGFNKNFKQGTCLFFPEHALHFPNVDLECFRENFVDYY